ncbi:MULTISPECIES: anti-sigma factor domain-containing protein [Actinoalloteichus]|uniref:Regulator of SigK n=1 Tax=Actinoalloteichus caeruleus DSM 43889 TaxID=1120930 RepID=A0ABT1JCA1_ACTCY|nr:anti-sigma factor [Actinoalloteichus caeruleus]MCP2329849.1 Anti-sigma-K factor RskA [Actinoalloteichus caeruleus DSM 43889]
MSVDIHSLTGAYALNAVTGEERTAFEEHLAACPVCAQEVRELRATAARVAGALPTTPCPGLRERVMAEVATVRQEPPLVDDGTRAGAPAPDVRSGAGRRWVVRSALALAAATAVLAGVLGGQAIQLREERDTLREELAGEAGPALSDLLASEDTRVVSGESEGGGTATAVVSREADRAVLLVSGMPDAPADHGYQLWLIDDQHARPAGMLDDGEGPVVLVKGLDGAERIGVTVEPAGGSRQPTTDPVMVLSLSG